MSGPMALSAATNLENLRDLALLVWRESRGASREAQVAVAHSVLNRVARPSWWGKTLDEVIWKKWQYSSLTAPGDPQLNLQPRLSSNGWLDALGVAYDVIHGEEANPFPGADSYYDDSIPAPKWVASVRLCGKLGTLNFYDVDKDHEAVEIVNIIAPEGSMSDFEKRLDAFLKHKGDVS